MSSSRMCPAVLLYGALLLILPFDAAAMTGGFSGPDAPSGPPDEPEPMLLTSLI